MTTAEFVRLEWEDRAAILTIDRTEALNALNLSVLSELSEALDAVAQSPARCLILTGAGERAFVAGADVAEMRPFSKEDALAFGRFGNQVFQKLNQLPIPVIAVINGFCLGGGLELALACDLRIATDRSVFSFPETGLGIIPGFGGTVRLPRLIGEGAALEMIYTGRRIKAEEALRLGLVNDVFSADDLTEKIGEWGRLISSRAPLAVRAAKASIRTGGNMTLDDALENESVIFSTLFDTNDQKKGMDALLTKTPHDGFTGE